MRSSNELTRPWNDVCVHATQDARRLKASRVLASSVVVTRRVLCATVVPLTNHGADGAPVNDASTPVTKVTHVDVVRAVCADDNSLRRRGCRPPRTTNASHDSRHRLVRWLKLEQTVRGKRCFLSAITLTLP